MRSLVVVVGVLFSLCSCAIGDADSRLQPEDLKRINNNEDSDTLSPHLLRDEDVHSLNSKGNNMILTVTREPEEDVYSLEDNEHDTTEDEQTDLDDIPIIISSEPVEEEVVFSTSTESSENHQTNHSEVLLQPIEPLSSVDILKRLENMMTQIRAQERTINDLKKNNKYLENKFDDIDGKTKLNNIIFLNIRESKRENYRSLLQKVIQILNRIMRLKVSFDSIVMTRRINGRNTDQFRPVVVTFTNFGTKLKVLAARNKLKKSKFDILDDYSELVTRTRRLLLPFLYEKRRQGHKVSMVADRLIVDGVKKSLSDLRQESRKSQKDYTKPKGFEDKSSQDELKEGKKENGA